MIRDFRLYKIFLQTGSVEINVGDIYLIFVFEDLGLHREESALGFLKDIYFVYDKPMGFLRHTSFWYDFHGLDELKCLAVTPKVITIV